MLYEVITLHFGDQGPHRIVISDKRDFGARPPHAEKVIVGRAPQHQEDEGNVITSYSIHYTKLYERYKPPAGAEGEIAADIEADGRISATLNETVLSSAGEYRIMASAMLGTEEVKSFGFIIRILPEFQPLPT